MPAHRWVVPLVLVGIAGFSSASNYVLPFPPMRPETHAECETLNRAYHQISKQILSRVSHEAGYTVNKPIFDEFTKVREIWNTEYLTCKRKVWALEEHRRKMGSFRSAQADRELLHSPAEGTWPGYTWTTPLEGLGSAVDIGQGIIDSFSGNRRTRAEAVTGLASMIMFRPYGPAALAVSFAEPILRGILYRNLELFQAAAKASETLRDTSPPDSAARLAGAAPQPDPALLADAISRAEATLARSAPARSSPELVTPTEDRASAVEARREGSLIAEPQGVAADASTSGRPSNNAFGMSGDVAACLKLGRQELSGPLTTLSSERTPERAIYGRVVDQFLQNSCPFVIGVVECIEKPLGTPWGCNLKKWFTDEDDVLIHSLPTTDAWKRELIMCRSVDARTMGPDYTSNDFPESVPCDRILVRIYEAANGSMRSLTEIAEAIAPGMFRQTISR